MPRQSCWQRVRTLAGSIPAFRPARHVRGKPVHLRVEPLEDRLTLSVSWQAAWVAQGPGPMLEGQPQGIEAKP